MTSSVSLFSLSLLKRLYFLNFLLLSITTLVFSRVPFFDFSLIEDTTHLDTNPQFTQITKETFSEVWKTPSPVYMPITYTFWAIAGKASHPKSFAEIPRTKTGVPKSFRFHPFWFHLLPLLFHLGTASLIFWFFCFLTSHPLASFLGALFFAIHPIQVESVAWVSGLKETLGGFFGVLAMCFFLLGEETPPKSKSFKFFLLASTLSFMLSLFSNPRSIAVPLILSGLMFFQYKKPRFLHAGKNLLLWIIFATPFLISHRLSKSWAQPRVVPLDIKSKVLLYLDSLSFYLGKILMPLHLGIDYGRTPEWVLTQTPVHTTAILFFVFFLALTLFLKWNKIQWALACESMIVLSLIPIYLFDRLLFQSSSSVADRDLYLGMIGISLAFAYISKFHLKKAWVSVTLLVWMVLLGTRSFFQTGYWANSQRLLSHALEINSESVLAHHTLGYLYEREEKYQEAISHYKTAGELNPQVGEFHRLGSIFLSMNQPNEAKTYFEKALIINPLSAESYHGLGLTYLELKNKPLARESFAKAIALSPNHLGSANALRYFQREDSKPKRKISSR